MIITYPTTP